MEDRSVLVARRSWQKDGFPIGFSVYLQISTEERDVREIRYVDDDDG